ncbi:glycine zipper family protein [Desulfogranum mediterraneum]|uniref:glycine zipper family protein n=1 Tax=Desulfogranum mediterraneum TaxID=160661 RepID=UPI0006883E11|nr:glycine zipper family protein [Desulfogranum mediterraneum]
MKKIVSFLVMFGAVLMLMGCGHTAARYQPIVDGPKDSKYFTDLSSCQQIAEERSYMNDEVKTRALLGAGLGAVVGVIDDGAGGALAGVIGGSLIGGGAGSWKTRTDRKNIVLQCMRMREYKVVEVPEQSLVSFWL